MKLTYVFWDHTSLLIAYFNFIVQPFFKFPILSRLPCIILHFYYGRVLPFSDFSFWNFIFLLFICSWDSPFTIQMTWIYCFMDCHFQSLRFGCLHTWQEHMTCHNLTWRPIYAMRGLRGYRDPTSLLPCPHPYCNIFLHFSRHNMHR